VPKTATLNDQAKGLERGSSYAAISCQGLVRLARAGKFQLPSAGPETAGAALMAPKRMSHKGSIEGPKT